MKSYTTRCRFLLFALCLGAFSNAGATRRESLEHDEQPLNNRVETLENYFEAAIADAERSEYPVMVYLSSSESEPTNNHEKLRKLKVSDELDDLLELVRKHHKKLEKKLSKKISELKKPCKAVAKKEPEDED